MSSFLPILLFGLVFSSFIFAKSRAQILASTTGVTLDSRPVYYGSYTVCRSVFWLICVLVLWLVFEPLFLRAYVFNTPGLTTVGREWGVLYSEIQNIATGAISADQTQPAIIEASQRYNQFKSSSRILFWLVIFGVSLTTILLSIKRISPAFKARLSVERFIVGSLFFSSTVAILTTVGIICSLIFESVRFFNRVSVTEFLFGLKWSPQMAIRADQVASSGAFGSVPLFVGTLLIAAIAMSVAVPLGLMSAIYLSEYASKSVRRIGKPVLEILAGIPTVVFGFFAAITVAPFFGDLGKQVGIAISAESALAAGVVMGVMIIPFISSLSDDVINAVPQTLRDGSYALGATKSETIKKVIIPAALPGIVGAILLAISRAIGETMIVVMAAGLAAHLTLNPAESVTTVTVQIVNILVGDQEFESAKTLAAFALGLVLFCVTLVLNVIALTVVKRYREKYE